MVAVLHPQPRVILGVLVFFAALAGTAKTSRACLAHYHSPEELISESPLVFEGRILAVKKLPRRHFGRSFYSTPIAATVRVLRCYKGVYKRQTMVVQLGPIASCAVQPIFYSPKKHVKRIFILPALPVKGRAELQYGGSLLTSGEAMVRYVLKRAAKTQRRFLDDLRRRRPKIYHDAERLNLRLRAAEKHWPFLTEIKEGSLMHWEKGRAFLAAERRLLQSLGTVDIDAIYGALALDWSGVGIAHWSKDVLWLFVSRQLAKKRHGDVASVQRRYWARRLRRAGVKARYISQYLAAIPQAGFGENVRFPMVAPQWFPSKRELLTTELILRGSVFDRGGFIRRYTFFSDASRRLNMSRCRRFLKKLALSPITSLRRRAAAIFGRPTVRRKPSTHHGAISR